jgi:chloramphenicol-sensitive protein RarD
MLKKRQTMNRGIILALSAYIFWGLHPIYWKQLNNVPSVEIVSHRVFWSFIFFSIIISFRKQWKTLGQKIQESHNRVILFLPAILIGSNWSIYIWAVNAGFIIETSLGYFICPLFSVFLGVIILKERLRIVQWLAIMIAGTGVLIMTFIYGQFPWIALCLTGTWGLYGLFRKKSPLSSVEGLTIETAIVSIPAIIYLISVQRAGEFSFLLDLKTSLLLVCSGIISGMPLMIFIEGVRKIKLSLIGILQYVYPTLIFINGFFIYNEPLSKATITGLIFIWIAIILYTIESTLFYHKQLKRAK